MTTNQVSFPMDLEVEKEAAVPLPIASPVRSTHAGMKILQQVLSFPVMLASFLVGFVFLQARLFTVDPDLWWHIKVGNAILSTHHWPVSDYYSFTVSNQPWIAYEWLGEVLLAAANRIGGIPALDALLFLLGSAIVIALYTLMTIRSGKSKAAFIGSAMLLLLATVSFSLRPQMLGYLFLILTLVALERFRQGKSRMLWFLPVLMLLWVNTHGSWIIGMGTIFVYWMSGLVEFKLGDLQAKRWDLIDRQRISFVFLLCLTVLPITPYGTRIAASPFEFAFSLPLNVASIEEWQPIAFNMFGGKLFLFLILSLLLTQVLVRNSWRLEELALFLFGTIMACLHVRFLLVFVPFFAPVIASILARWIPSYNRDKDKFVINAAVIATIVVLMIHYSPTSSELHKRVAKTFPVGAVAYLQEHPTDGPMFNNYGFGGYLVYSRGPEHKVFIDGRGDVYERGGLLADYLHISRLRPGALRVLAGYDIRSCLLQRDEPLANVLSDSPDWQRTYSDDTSVLFVRRHTSVARMF